MKDFFIGSIPPPSDKKVSLSNSNYTHLDYLSKVVFFEQSIIQECHPTVDHMNTYNAFGWTGGRGFII